MLRNSESFFRLWSTRFKIFWNLFSRGVILFLIVAGYIHSPHIYSHSLYIPHDRYSLYIPLIYIHIHSTFPMISIHIHSTFPSYILTFTLHSPHIYSHSLYIPHHRYLHSLYIPLIYTHIHSTFPIIGIYIHSTFPIIGIHFTFTLYILVFFSLCTPLKVRDSIAVDKRMKCSLRIHNTVGSCVMKPGQGNQSFYASIYRRINVCSIELSLD